jgi:hypothetical protein
MIPALFTRMCSGPVQPETNSPTEARSARSSRATRTRGLPPAALIADAAFSPASVSRTARVTSAPAPASTRAVSWPMPEEAPVTIARLPVRSTRR